MTLDIRDIIRHEANTRNMTRQEAARELKYDASCLSNMFNGSQAVPLRVFLRAVNVWQIKADRSKLQRWLTAFLLEKFGPDFCALLKKAGWTYDSSSTEDVSKSEDFDLSWALVKAPKFGSTELARRRRMQLLEAVRKAEGNAVGGFIIDSDRCAIREMRDQQRRDLRALEEVGLLRKHKVRVFSRVDVNGNKRDQEQNCWTLCDAGAALLEESRSRSKQR